MFLLACLLLSSVSLGHSHRIATTKVPRNGCRNSDLYLIKSYFEATTINRGDATEPVYCVTNKTSEELPKPPPIDLSQLIDLYKSFENVHKYSYTLDPNYVNEGPMVTGSVLLINDSRQMLTLSLKADIRRSHLARPNSYPEYGDDVTKQMDLMGVLESDDRGYLLPHSLGGLSRARNMVPMARNVNRHLSLAPEDCGLGRPRSNWRSHENWIRKFLLHAYPNGRVVRKLAVQYEDCVFTDTGQCGSYRPLSFALQYHAFSNEHDDNSVYYISPQMTFLNDNDYSCQNDVAYHREEIHVPSNCTVHDSFRKAGTIGPRVSRGEWETTHVVSFPFNIQGKTYIYGQSAGDAQQKFHWFIREILSTGEMGEEASFGYWNASYSVSFPYFINGRQYFYAHNIENGDWFIRELLPEGGMGEETSRGKWQYTYPISFPFTINGKHYFYGQEAKDVNNDINNNWWFIQELLPNGQMGREISQGSRSENYPVVFPYSINNRHMFYAHNPETKGWFVQELLPEGKMGEVLNRGQWLGGYHVSFSYSSGDKYYFYGLNAGPEVLHRWYIQELPPNGKMGEEISEGYDENRYSIAFPFAIYNRGRYIYQYSNEAREWKISELF